MYSLPVPQFLLYFNPRPCVRGDLDGASMDLLGEISIHAPA